MSSADGTLPQEVRTAATLLRSAPVEQLLRTAFSLTHRMHAATDLRLSAELRAQRKLIEDEIARRCEA